MVQQEEEEREAEWERRRAELTSQKEERGEEATEGKIAALQAAIKRNELIREGTLVCFSNYAAVHRVLRMEV